MRYGHALNLMETGEAINVRRSTVKTSRKTIRSQIADLYSDRIDAIVREITANGFDSHKRAGETRPFFVHCPTAISPEFFVRDYGVGMTDQVMGETYIVIGESDKDESDDETGMWGLGSKAPFAYADQYTITCYDGVEARHYGYGIAEDGVPTLYLMAIEPNDEPRGVRVGVSIEAKDFGAFEKAIRHAYLAHADLTAEAPAPSFESNVQNLTLGEIELKGDGWLAMTGSPLKSGRLISWWARQGCVLYPIDTSHVQVLSDYQRERTFILDCPIGTIKITPSREALQYDDETIAYLKTRVEGVRDEIGESVWQAVKDIESVPEFFKTLEKIKPTFVDRQFEHPLTGLTSATLKATYPALFYKIKFEHGQWTFEMKADMGLGSPPANLFLLDDLSPFFDPSRGDEVPTGGAWLTRSEQRRIARFMRAYLTANKMADAQVMCGLEMSDEMLKACFPRREVTRITFADLRDAVPRRVAPPVDKAKPPIKGLALAKAAGEQKPVFEVMEPSASVAWVSSEMYRRNASALFKLAKTLGVTELYIAAPGAALEQVETAGHAALRARFEERLAKIKMTPGDWFAVRGDFQRYGRQLFEWLGVISQHASAAHKVLLKGDGVISDYARATKRLNGASKLTLTDEELKAAQSLYTDDQGKTQLPPPHKSVAEATKLAQAIGVNYGNPTTRFIDSLPKTHDVAIQTRMVEALIALQTLVPPTEKFS